MAVGVWQAGSPRIVRQLVVATTLVVEAVLPKLNPLADNDQNHARALRSVPPRHPSTASREQPAQLLGDLTLLQAAELGVRSRGQQQTSGPV